MTRGRKNKYGRRIEAFEWSRECEVARGWQDKDERSALRSTFFWIRQLALCFWELWQKKREIKQKANGGEISCGVPRALVAPREQPSACETCTQFMVSGGCTEKKRAKLSIILFYFVFPLKLPCRAGDRIVGCFLWTVDQRKKNPQLFLMIILRRDFRQIFCSSFFSLVSLSFEKNHPSCFLDNSFARRNQGYISQWSNTQEERFSLRWTQPIKDATGTHIDLGGNGASGRVGKYENRGEKTLGWLSEAKCGERRG